MKMRMYDALKAVALLMLFVFSQKLYAAEFGLKQLVEGWADLQEVNADYVSQQSSVFFDEPVESKGTFSYVAPDTLERNILEPIKEILRVQGDQLYIKKTQTSEKKGEHVEEQQYTISSHEQLNLAITALKAFLGGDISQLDEYFTANIKGNQQQWQLALAPAHDKIAEKYRSISLSGNDLKINEVVFVNNNDEETTININYTRFE